MLRLSFGKESSFYNQKPVPKETEHLGAVEEAQTFAILLLACVHEPAPRILLFSSKSCQDGVVFQSFNKGPEMFTVLLSCILQADFKLMCDNAMTYNRPDTVYYKLAKKILHTGFKMMSKVRDLLKTKSRNFGGFYVTILKRNKVTMVNVVSSICDEFEPCHLVLLYLRT